MGKLLKVFFIFIFLILSINKGLAAEKLGYVDLSKLFDEYNKTKEYDKILEERQKVYELEREKRVKDIKQMQDSLNLLSDKEKESKKQDLDQKIKSLQDFDLKNTQDLRRERDEKMKEILKDIEAAISEYASKEGYTLVFNDRVLVYQDKSLDITDKVLNILQKKYPAQK
ncbi:MAG: OmpH family outer membrane protein [Candidatus Omnitrophica bacterium]|nr:OmpH family outer membrane protein [Candidatus Omnitrophota bacterium]MCM8799780.1 OmpH family outer membrane protein [Candidatus Omnitrophota bacterium]